ncbi:hypothetical protein FGO68_gene3515 [Halteria grandinella]|uniref:Uncharacterized protein n=1 Tax=Halteria grandinella TaxID=5974 RepID=A0A8J8P6G6_HALGN|nr:hypothetical protein FGO68_gene3515 [Halteria grandinella]
MEEPELQNQSSLQRVDNPSPMQVKTIPTTGGDPDPFRSKREINRTFYPSNNPFTSETPIKPLIKKKGEQQPPVGMLSDLTMKQPPPPTTNQRRLIEYDTPQQDNRESPQAMNIKRKRDMINGVDADQSTFVITQLPRQEAPSNMATNRNSLLAKGEDPDILEQRRQQQQRYQEELRRQIEERNQMQKENVGKRRPQSQFEEYEKTPPQQKQELQKPLHERRQSQQPTPDYYSQRPTQPPLQQQAYQKPPQSDYDLPLPLQGYQKVPLPTFNPTSFTRKPSPQKHHTSKTPQMTIGLGVQNTGPILKQQQQQYFNPSNVLMFQKINSQIDIEMQQLRTQAQSQQRMMLLQIQNLHSEASKIRFEATNTLKTYETYTKRDQQNDYTPFNQQIGTGGGLSSVDTYKETHALIKAGESIMNQQSKHLNSQRGPSSYEPGKQHLQVQSKMYPLSQFTPNINVQGSFHLPKYDEIGGLVVRNQAIQEKPLHLNQTPISNRPSNTPDTETIDKDDAFAALRDIERMTEQNEVDLHKYQSYTEKRYNTERFLEEMEMRREFGPELSVALEIEREDLLRRVDKRVEDGKLQANMLRSKDIVFELLEQSLVHENLDKIRRDLDEFSYKTRDASHLLSLPFVNPNPPKSMEQQQVADITIKPLQQTPLVSTEDQQEKESLIKLHQLPVLDFTEAPSGDDSDNLLNKISQPPLTSPPVVSSDENDIVKPSPPPPERNPDHIKSAFKLAQHDDDQYADDFAASGINSPAPERNEEHIKSASQLNNSTFNEGTNLHASFGVRNTNVKTVEAKEQPPAKALTIKSELNPPQGLSQPASSKNESLSLGLGDVKQSQEGGGMKKQASASRYDFFGGAAQQNVEKSNGKPDEIDDNYDF